jgi:hypothetical protein
VALDGQPEGGRAGPLGLARRGCRRPFAPIVRQIQATGVVTFRAIPRRPNARGIRRTTRGMTASPWSKGLLVRYHLVGETWRKRGPAIGWQSV